ncbi:MAG TPA: amino acid adenylation domain-containing protein [Gemmatimonadota bacterium]|nr:amino acid adenylation domain-containing protein [Gemmatimonadota bacterium]
MNAQRVLDRGGAQALDSEVVRLAPASYAQRQFWLLDRLTGGHPVYNAARRYHLTGPLNVPALERALAEITRRHEILRTRLPEREGEPIQEILPASSLQIPVQDLTGHGEAVDGRLAAFERAESRRAFDLATGPTWRAALARLGPTEHVLLLTFHHAVLDGWSRLVLEKELGTLYGAFVGGESSPLGELPVQYSDYAAWECQRLSGGLLERLLTYWREQLAELPSVDLPIDRQRPSHATFDGARHQFEIPSKLVQRLRSFAASQKATPFMVLMALFQSLIYRLTGVDDVPVGCPTAGRTMPGTEGLIGCFINPVVIRGDLSGNPTFEELVGRTRQRTISALSHAELRFEHLVLKLRPGRIQGVNPLFQVLFQLRTFPQTSVEMFPGLSVESEFIDTGGATVDQAWSLDAHGDRIVARVEYNTALFDERTVCRMGERFLRMLEGALDDSGARLSALPLLDEAERRRIEVEWNETATPYPRERSVVDLFVEHAGRDPKAIAIEQGDARIRYGELDARSRGLARAVVESGVEPGSLVGLCMGRSIDMIVGMLAVLRSGAAYVPLDPHDPDERLTFMSRDADLAAVVVGAGDGRRAFGTGIPVLTSSTDPHDPPYRGPTGAARSPGPEDLAYVLYTSGSTGRPKGVAVEHRAVVRLVRDTDYVSIRPGDRLAHVSHPSFDATTFEVWGALLNGASIVILDSDTMLEPPRLARELEARGVTELFLTTALFNAVADEVPGAFRTVRTVLFGGEAVDPARVRKVLGAEPPERLLHVYGPTECTTFATWHQVSEVPETATTVPIGRPIANTRAWVVDPHGSIVPADVAGELLLGGDGLARGYHGMPELTRERFVQAPFGTGERVYRTGDRVRREENGSIVFLGRLDRQIKLRGFRIEPGEIEAALGSHPSVRECVVAVREATPGDRRLVAWVVAAESLSSEDLNRFLSVRLPRFMLPSAYVVLEAMPLNRNGKVDVKALPDPPAPKQTAGPQTETERLLAEVWRGILGVSEVGRTDDFYDLGGHSLLAVRLFSEIEQRTGRRLPFSIFDRGLTIAAVAESLERNDTVPGTDYLVPILTGGSRTPLFLVHAGGGNIYVYRSLAEHLARDRPVFGFNLKGIRRVDLPRTVEEMAERYLNDLEIALPTGPCLLGGYSFGGVVAWEMARRLRARGRAVPLLVLLEATDDLLQAHRAPVRMWRRARRFAGSGVRGLADLARNPPSRWFSILSGRGRQALAVLLDRPDPLATTTEEAAAMKAAARWAIRHYRPGRYAGRTLYFRATGQIGRRLVWQSLADDLEIVILPGELHGSFLKQENARFVAEALDARLREAD